MPGDTSGMWWIIFPSQQFRRSAQNRRKHPEVPAVTHLQKLSDGHGAGFPKPVDAVSGKIDEDENRDEKRLPVTDRETGFVIGFTAFT